MKKHMITYKYKKGCDLGSIGVLECLAGVVLWSTLGVVCWTVADWLEHVR